MIINPKETSTEETAALLTGCVIPRPIAFVTSLNHAGRVNAAPFCFFSIVNVNPPLISISCMRKQNGQMKDTAYNIWKQNEFVVHVVDDAYVKKVLAASGNFPYEVSEAEKMDMPTCKSEKVVVPGLKNSKVRLECILFDRIPLKNDQNETTADLIIGEVVCFHIAEELYKDGRILTENIHPICRLNGDHFSKIKETMVLEKEVYKYCTP